MSEEYCLRRRVHGTAIHVMQGKTSRGNSLVRARFVFLLCVAAAFFYLQQNTFLGVRIAKRCHPTLTVNALPDDRASEGLTTLSTEAVIDAEAADVLATVATASSWPSIVLSSTIVQGQITRPLAAGDIVEEYFGLPPFWAPCVTWTCAACDLENGILDMTSEGGVEGLADRCRMLFTVNQQGNFTQLRLDMSYRPLGLLARLAQPFLEADNMFALRVLLPAEVKRRCSATR